MVYNKYDLISGSYKLGGTVSLATWNLSGRKIDYVSDTSGIGRWSWQRLQGQGNTNLHKNTFYIPVPPNQGEGMGSVYAQQFTLFNNTGRRERPIHAFLLYLYGGNLYMV